MLLDMFFNDDKAILTKCREKIRKINELEDKYKNMSNDELKKMTEYFKMLLKDGSTLDDILCDAYAVVREVCKRVKGQFPYDVQLLGAIVMHNGDIAEMKTGEGKTLTAVLPVYLNALSGKGVHVITVNEYLAKRDAELNGDIYRFLGLSVGVNKNGLHANQKRQAYLCDITYTTSSELGFDYLRDNMVTHKEDRVLRELNFALIDEIDSILIDEARTPLIISGEKKDTNHLYKCVDSFVKKLTYDDFNIEYKEKIIVLNEFGIKKAETYFKLDNLYDIQYKDLVHCINQALKANYIMKKDVDYIVDEINDKVIIVDMFTGRIMDGRSYCDGLHQAIEAKEGISIKEEAITIATIIYQNFFRLYNKLCGMTGTAKREENEFLSTYNMRVIQIPTNKQIVRKDLNDKLFLTKKEKLFAVLEKVKELNAIGQPILIGTTSIEASLEISNILYEAGIKHQVLNAKNHQREAEIIANAGEMYAVTIATNMAGRGTDIKISDNVRSLGGLAVIATERHDSRRIDDQLRGRSGRQGDPGVTQFYLSLEDDLLKMYGDENKYNKILKNKYNKIFIRKFIDNAQSSIEGINADIRRNVLEYDEVIKEQRTIIYAQRNYILDNDNVGDIICDMFKKACEYISDNEELICKYINEFNLIESDLPKKEIKERLYKLFWDDFNKKTYKIGEYIERIERQVALQTIDKEWIKHIDAMDKLRRGIGLRNYAVSNPLEEYVKEGFELFNLMQNNVALSITLFLMRMKVVEEV